MKLLIKNMVCPRCIIVVGQLLAKNGLKANNILLGEVELHEKPSDEQLKLLSDSLQKVGFELLNDQKKQLVENIKIFLIQNIQEGNIEGHFSIKIFLCNAFRKDYSTLTKLFTECEGCTIEQFFILQKVEKVKELLQYNELTINEIAVGLGYSSMQHLCTQFKKVTGFTSGQFKKRAARERKPIDNLIVPHTFTNPNNSLKYKSYP